MRPDHSGISPLLVFKGGGEVFRRRVALPCFRPKGIPVAKSRGKGVAAQFEPFQPQGPELRHFHEPERQAKLAP